MMRMLRILNCCFVQDGRIDYNEFVAMMQKGSIAGGGGPVKMGGLEKSFSIALKL